MPQLANYIVAYWCYMHWRKNRKGNGEFRVGADAILNRVVRVDITENTDVGGKHSNEARE